MPDRGAGTLGAVPLRYPDPLTPGDRIAITAPSAGVPADLRPRLDFCVQHLRRRGYDVVLGECLDGTGVVSAPAAARAAELTAFLTDPSIAAVVPPWGGELAVEVLPHLDLQAVAAAEPTWLVGYSDTSTLLLALTTTTGIATVHGQNLLDTPYRVPSPLASWLDVTALPTGAAFTQGPSSHHRAAGFDSWQDDPTVSDFTLDTPGTWHLLHDPTHTSTGTDSGHPDPEGTLRARGRLIGGCIETVSTLAGTPFGDLGAFAAEHAPEGLIVYLEAGGEEATSIARHLWRLRLAGWFEHANAVLIGRTRAPDSDGFTQRDAIRSVLGELAVPVVLDVDCGHVPPHLALINGALAELTMTTSSTTLTQHLC
ncbi:S66 family peptidase [Kineococcus arenarius]|uniref:S66 family peptidase n=1 Tax=unclassified Kineococcus TaxID=2621656 RepID=UPI003D7D2EC8